MASRFEDRFHARAVPVLNREHSVEITIASNGQTSGTFSARRGKSVHEVLVPGMDVLTGVVRRAYIFAAADCVLGGVTTVPQVGFRITEGSEVFEIEPPNETTKAVQLMLGSHEYLVYVTKIK